MVLDELALRGFLIGWEFWLLEILFGTTLILTICAVRASRVDRRCLIAAAVISASAWLLTSTLPPRTNRIFYDEHIYQDVAHNMSDQHLTQMCNEGHVELGRLHCVRGEFNKEPSGYPYLLALVYRLAGVHESSAYRLNNLAAAAMAGAVVILSWLLFESYSAAITAGATLMLLPMQLTWSNTAAVEPTTALAACLAVSTTVYFARVRSGVALSWAIATTAFAVNFRPESSLLWAINAVAILMLAPDEFRKPRLWLAVLAWALLSTPALAHLAAVRSHNWDSTSSRFAWEYAARNAPVNAQFYFADARFSSVAGFAAIVGLLDFRRIRERALLLAYFGAFWVVVVFFYAGSYSYGANVRYSLLTYVPLSVLSGLGIERVARAIARRIAAEPKPALPLLVALTALSTQFLWYTPLVREIGDEAWAARADVKYARSFASSLPPNSLVLTQIPQMFLLFGTNAAQLSLASTESAYVRDSLFARYAGGVYVHWNFWCNIPDPVQVAFCKQALANFNNSEVRSANERDFHFAMYRLQRR